MGDLNIQLNQLYSARWDKLNSEIKEKTDLGYFDFNPTNPLLIQVDDEEAWQNADIRLMFFGQETNSWCSEFNEAAKPDRPGLKYLLNTYDCYFNQEGCWDNPTPFFRGIGRFIELLSEKFPKPLKISFIWNNIIKLGKDGIGHPGFKIYNIEQENFSVIRDEVKLLKPNLIIFFTGHKYDKEIKDNFGDQEFAKIGPYPMKEIAKVKIDDVKYAFRTYHSGYLWRWRKNEIDDFFNEIIDKINI